MFSKPTAKDLLNILSGFSLGAAVVLGVWAWRPEKSKPSDPPPSGGLSERPLPRLQAPALSPFPSLSPTQPALPLSPEQQSPAREKTPPASAVVDALPGKDEPPGAIPPEAVSEESNAFAAIFEMEEGEEQNTAFQTLVKNITPEKAELWHKAWMRGPYMEADTDMTHLYNCRIGEVYGPVVVGVRDGYGSKDMMGADWFVKDQFQGWIRSDPAAAEKWLDGLQHPEFRAAMERAWDESAQASQEASRQP